MAGIKDPWPLSGRVDQRDRAMTSRAPIAPYGCAMCLAFNAGAFLSGRAPWTPRQIVALYDDASKKGVVRASDCFIENWDQAIDLAADGNVVDYLGHKAADYPLSPEEIVFDVWKRTDINVGVHFVWQHFDEARGIAIRYDPLGSAVGDSRGNLSNSRKYGELVSRRAFKILVPLDSVYGAK